MQWGCFNFLLILVWFGACQGLYSSNSPVVILDDKNFKSSIKGSKGGLWLVEFYAPWCGHCKQLKPEWEKAAIALKGIINVAAADVDEHQSLAGEHGIQGFPTIKLFYVDDGSGKLKSSDYNGGRTASSIIDFAFTQAKKIANARIGVKKSSSSDSSKGGGSSDSGFYGGTPVVSLSDSDFHDEVTSSDDLWLVEFYAPWCGHCKNLKGDWIEAAGQLKGKVKLGAINCDEEKSVCSEFGVRGFPTIKWFGTDKDKPKDYDQPREAAAIVQFALQRWTKLAPPPEVYELTSQESFEDECIGHAGDEDLELEEVQAKQLCFLAFLPNIIDTGAAGRKEYIQILNKMAESYKERPFSYFWVEGAKQPNVEKSLEVGGFGYPALVALSPTKKAFAPLKGRFEFKQIEEFVTSLRTGHSKLTRLSDEQMPTVESIDPWDGKDAQLEVEEEFDLADLMGWDESQNEIKQEL
eukprot:TRINITY_DN12033_c0_g1_i1.p1 TRINITY_DN12033_c0_g1~~TRINITY_DN12033_c0_g1_i1.p1  ORF type:complete len:466 (+),score=101.85 TRINITY_DN12033_c0_g1_i1:119-1516(+)